MSPPSYEDVLGAAERISDHVHRTPVFTSAAVDERASATVFAKAENLQKVGAFKARGATNAVLSLGNEARGRGIATHSSGNHGQAVAYAASIVDCTATVVMPEHAPQIKIDAVRSYGAEVVLCEQPDREAVLGEIAERTGATVVHPFDDPAVIAGQGTAALELVSEVPDLDVILTPIGGGGLLSGSTLVANEHGIPTAGVEPEIVDDAFRSLRDRVRHPATGAISVGDGLLTGIGEIPFDILDAARVPIVTVSEEAIRTACRFVVMRTKYLIEPSAATVFAALFGDHEWEGARIGVVVSGGNVDPSAFASWGP